MRQTQNVALTRKDKGKGLRRTQKQWENTIAEHIGKFADRLTGDDLAFLVAWASGTGLGILGMQHFVSTWTPPATLPPMGPLWWIAEQIAATQGLEFPIKERKAIANSPEAYLLYFAASAFGSYMVLKHGGDLLGAVGGLAKII